MARELMQLSALYFSVTAQDASPQKGEKNVLPYLALGIFVGWGASFAVSIGNMLGKEDANLLQGQALSPSETISALAETANSAVILSKKGARLDWEGSTPVVSLGEAFSVAQAQSQETNKQTYAIVHNHQTEVGRIHCKPQSNKAPACSVYLPR